MCTEDSGYHKKSSVRELNWLRDNLVHFKVGAWGIGVGGFPEMAMHCVEVLEFLAVESGNVLWTDQSLRQRYDSAASSLLSALEQLRGAH